MRVIVTGSRRWEDPGAARRAIVNRLFGIPTNAVIVVGYDPETDHPKGVDRFAYQEAQKLGLGVEAHPARWQEHDREGQTKVRCYCKPGQETCKAAGFRRNQEMVDLGAYMAIAFWNGKSSGTRDCMDRCRAAGIYVEEVVVP